MDEKKWAEAHHCAAIFAAEWLAADGYDILFVKADPHSSYDLAARHTQRLVIAEISVEVEGNDGWIRSKDKRVNLITVAADNRAIACICSVALTQNLEVKNISLINIENNELYDWRHDEKYSCDGVEIGPHELLWSGIGASINHFRKGGGKIRWLNWACSTTPNMVIEGVDGKLISVLVRVTRHPIKIAPICPLSLEKAKSWAHNNKLPLVIISVSQASMNDPFDPAFADEDTPSCYIVPLYRSIPLWPRIDGPFMPNEYPGRVQEDVASLQCR
ncbi:hypothetical protein [Magnetospirillum sp. ME-1]|uniref:hypothetical protein n=1 Tax=Magnetospirillum sp. ME-1 TaxID=1639348 RepID=UPI0011AE6AD2|nr:hypothetical protein [Magnetospirillum sp. ME-1]